MRCHRLDRARVDVGSRGASHVGQGSWETERGRVRHRTPFGLLGLGPGSPAALSPVIAPAFVVEIDVAQSGSFARDAAGNLWMTGSAAGIGATNVASRPTLGPGLPPVSACAARNHVLAQCSGVVYGFGSINAYGELGPAPASQTAGNTFLRRVPGLPPQSCRRCRLGSQSRARRQWRRAGVGNQQLGRAHAEPASRVSRSATFCDIAA